MSEPINWSPGVTLEAIERQVITKAYFHFRNNKTVTSNSLGISIRTLDSKLAKYQDEDKEHEDRTNAQRARDAEHQRRARGFHTGPDHTVVVGEQPAVDFQLEAPRLSEPKVQVTDLRPKKRG